MSGRVVVALLFLVTGCATRPVSPNPRSVIVAGIVLKWIRGDKAANYARIEPMIRAAA